MSTAQVIELVQQPSAADVALAEMRAQFGRNGAASRWSRLSIKARAVICYAAGLSPERYKGMELREFDFEQQEVIRLALGELLATLHQFDGDVLHRREWHRTTRIEGPSRNKLEQAEHENMRRAELNEQAGILESRLAVVRKVAGNGQ
ncbi:MAG: hypothetical protein ACRCYW_14355 [Aeromonas sp.]|uniref:hypothetical protein n=1 Tax=Aeromonas sp. TaxID=647 RepID=UPI003F3FF761